MGSRKTLKEKIRTVPVVPGVYFFKDHTGEIMYIGKARALKKRLLSYAQKQHTAYRTEVMVEQIADVEYIETASEIEALLLESSLIKKHQPKYNVLLRDDKSFPYLKLTRKEPFPRLIITRRRERDGAKYFGPYTDAALLRAALKVMREIFPLRTCNKIPAAKCLQFHIGQCGAPCEGLQSEKEYRQIVRELELFLAGKKSQLMRALTRDMHTVSQARDFEKAARIRDRLAALNVLSTQRSLSRKGVVAGLTALSELKELLRLPKVPRRIEGYDIANIGWHEAVGAVVCFVDGRPDKNAYRQVKIKSFRGIDDYRMMREVLSRRLARLEKHREMLPDLLVIDGGKGHLSAAQAELAEHHMEHIPVISIAKQFEELFIPGRKTSLCLPESSRALLLLRRLRDEAHRFAQRYHHTLRGRLTRQSQLDMIHGIGADKKKRLIAHFGSVDTIAAASVEQLMGVDGFGKKTARCIYDYFHA